MGDMETKNCIVCRKDSRGAVAAGHVRMPDGAEVLATFCSKACSSKAPTGLPRRPGYLGDYEEWMGLEPGGRTAMSGTGDPLSTLRALVAEVRELDRPWRLRLICCARSDGELRFATSEEADMAREAYTSGTAVAEHGYSAGLEEAGHRRAAIKEHIEAGPDMLSRLASVVEILANTLEGILTGCPEEELAEETEHGADHALARAALARAAEAAKEKR